MTPEDMARIHAAAFAPTRGWSAAEFAALLDGPYVTLFARSCAFALVQTVDDETELLTLATAPEAQRQGLARSLLREWLSETLAKRAFLDVSADNPRARRLYEKLGFVEYGRRRDYYARSDGACNDAVLMQKALTPRHHANSAAPAVKTG